MSNKDNEKILGIIILVGLALIILVALLQVLTIIFMVLTFAAIIATIAFVILGIINEYEREDYLMYAGIAFLGIFLFFIAGKVTYSASESLLTNDLTSGLMEFTAFFFRVQLEKQEAIVELREVQVSAISNLTDLLDGG